MKNILLLTALFLMPFSKAQFIDLLKDKVKGKAADLASEKLIGSITSESITTNFKDCNTKDIKTSGFAKSEKFTNLCPEKFSKENGYLLKPGYYEINLKSFCLKAGTYAPSKGDGYLYAPLKGPKEEIIDALVKNWYQHQDISQQDVQSLIWAVIAKASFKDLNNQLKVVAARLLTKNDILKLSKMGLDFVPSNIMNKAKSNLPKPVQLVLDAENKMRNFFNTSSSNFADLERLAMLAGMNPEKSDVEYGTWGLHPKGYWISYQPNGYSQMKIQIYVPNSISSVSFYPSNDVAVPANTSSQRLMVSDVLNCR